MQKKLVFIIGFLIFLGCQSNIDKEELELLNGYWEIDEVKMPDGTFKDYEINQTVDYIFLKDTIGFRKKVAPQLDGTYLVTNHQETFVVITENEVFFLEYKTEYGIWREKLIDLCEEHFTVENENGIIYTYKKQEAFSIK